MFKNLIKNRTKKSENLVEIFKKLDIGLEEDDYQELFELHSQELTNEELMEMQTMQGPDDDEEEILPLKKIETKLFYRESCGYF